MQPFSYLRPESLADAVRAAGAADAKVIAGGQSLLGAMKLGLAAHGTLVDLQGVPGLSKIALDAGALTIGALATHAEVAASAVVRQAIPALAALAGQIGDRQVRHRGTHGGSLANNDPAACYPAALLALDATVHTDRRRIAAADFFRGFYTTALAADELITAVSFALPERAAYQKLPQPASRFALVGVFVARGPGGVRVAVTGAASGAMRVAALEARLARDWSAAACEGVSLPADGFGSDLHASAEYRAAMVPVLAARAVASS